MAPRVPTASVRASVRSRAARALLLAGLAMAGAGASASPWPAGTLDEVARFARDAAERATSGLEGLSRIEVRVGDADPRLQLAPCRQVELRAVPGAGAIGRTRVNLQCVQGDARWSISLPVTVEVWATAWVAARSVPAGSSLQADDYKPAVVDIAHDRSAVVPPAQAPLGRELQRSLAPGETLRQAHLRSRQWFAAGDTVRVLAVGSGFAVVGSGQALSAGVEGQPARIRTESGRIVSGTATGERAVEIRL